MSSFLEDWVRESEKACKDFFDNVGCLHSEIEERLEKNIRHYAKMNPSK